MLKKTFGLLASAALLASISACSTTGTSPPASDIAPRRDLTSWCQGDRTISYQSAPEAGVDDPKNRFDSDETVAEVQAHNARLRAACPQTGAGNTPK